jgi:hypothetical protein
MADMLRKSGSAVTMLDDALDLEALPDSSSKQQGYARKDFSSFQQKYNLDKLLIVEITTLGFTRNYASYVPTSDPKATLTGAGYLVDLKTNTYDWYKPVSVTKSADQAWDEPPNFPGLTNAYFQAQILGKDSLLEPFTSNVVAEEKPETPASASVVVGTALTQPARQ